MKYSINGTGNIVAERDIFSLGGYIPQGTVGGKIASEAQLSQDGECWIAGGDISGRPDIRIKDNAYVGMFTPGVNPVHTDGVTEFSGSTLIPGNLSVRSFVADTKNNVFIKDSFIGVSMDVLCGSATGTNFPFEPGDFRQEAPAGTLFTSGSMQLSDPTACRNTATLRLGKDTYVYVPAGYRGRIFWAYLSTSNQLAYSGESLAISSGLTKLSHPIYNLAMIVIVNNSGNMTPAQLGASGAKILGHISGSLLMDLRPESASGQYVMDKSSFLMNTDNFGLSTTQLRFLAGSMYNTNMYTLSDRQDYKPFGTFRNVERLEYNQYFADIHRGNANRDRYIVASDSPLVRINDGFVSGDLVNAGGVTLRRCIVPKAEFQNDVINGNTYEDIDFSYANEDLGFTMAGYTRFISSHEQGIYRMSGGPSSTGFASHKGNLDPTARLYQGEIYLPLDGSIMEQGAYGGGSQIPYESAKTASAIRIRTGKPLRTFGLIFPSLPAGYSVKALYYLDEDFIIRSTITDPTELVTTYPYVVMLFRKDDDTAITVTDFIALNRTLRIIDHTKAPEITGSAYVGEGVTVRGDVKLIGDPYVNRLLDVNLWEKGSISVPDNGWDSAKNPPGGPTDVDRRRLKEVIPVEPGAKITCNSGYWVNCYFYDANGNYLSSPGWGRTGSTAPVNAAFAGVIFKKGASVNDNLYVEDSDIPLANVKYVRAFEKRRYITNELDRTSPKDILLGPDMWEQGTVGGGQTDGGKTYEELKAPSGSTIRIMRPINMSPLSSSISTATGFVRFIRVLDAATKFHLGESLTSDKMALLAAIIQKDPPASTIPSDITNARLVLEFVPQPRIIVPYGASGIFITGMKIRMYDNAVLSKNINVPEELILKGDAVVSHLPAGCVCGWGDSDAIIKL